jgi:phage head maturation protease
MPKKIEVTPEMKQRAPAGLPEGLTVRAATATPKSFREDDNSVEFVLTTEAPAYVMDWQRWEVVREVLIADGLVLPKTKKVPLLDSHNRYTTQNIYGSVSDIKVEPGQVTGRLFFSASDDNAQKALKKVQEGHIDSGSVGYSQIKSKWIEEGKTYTYKGKTYEGPLLLTTKWQLSEYSLVAIGADSDAKSREAVYSEPADNEPETDETEIVSREAVEMDCNARTDDLTQINKEIVTMPTENKNIEQPTVDTKAIERAAAVAEKARIEALSALCTKHEVSELLAGFIKDDVAIENAREIVLDKIAERQAKPIQGATADVTMGRTEEEKFRAAAVDGLLIRAGVNVQNTADGASNLSRLTFKSLAREILHRAGVKTIHMSDTEALEAAMRHRSGIMGTSDFAYILDAAGNKAVSTGFAAAQQAWRLVFKKGSLPNLEQFRRVNLQDAPDMLALDQGGEIQHGTIGDKGEAIQLATYARKIRITRRALLADDLGLFDSLFVKFGARAGNSIDAISFGLLTSNPNMADGNALFLDTAARGNNLATTPAVVSATSVDIGYQRMMKQAGPNGVKYGIVPRFLIVGPKNRVNAHILTTSMQDTTASSNANGASNAFSDLQAITTPHLGNDWYLAASPAMADTIEVAFLDGKETPTIYTVENDGDILGRTFIAYFDVGAAAIGFEGLFKNAGS